MPAATQAAPAPPRSAGLPADVASAPAPPPSGLPAASPPGPPAAPAAPFPVVVETGNAGVDAALARLEDVGEVPAEARAGVYGEVHDLLRDTLAGLDERTGGAPTPLNVVR
ncbi:hypothetical protein [Streptacidiphilus melanogenes]|uniref:hypothetical protein n=1 Tax=Streptacidiphilus melanogenes TaxID=411235 RepID=UPI0006948B5C|nr:hypothetical protein [Streptacidiphilus melanogenes]